MKLSKLPNYEQSDQLHQPRRSTEDHQEGKQVDLQKADPLGLTWILRTQRFSPTPSVTHLAQTLRLNVLAVAVPTEFRRPLLRFGHNCPRWSIQLLGNVAAIGPRTRQGLLRICSVIGLLLLSSRGDDRLGVGCWC